jgi:two-component system NtrC family sensor kinase
MFRHGKWSIPSVLLSTLVVSVLVTGAVVGWLVASGVTGVVRDQAQERVGEDLRALSELLDRRRDNLTRALSGLASSEAPDSFGETRLAGLRKALRLDLLRVCDAEGRLLGSEDTLVPIEEDPVLRRALRGQENSGYVQLPVARLIAEGGAPLARALRVTRGELDIRDALMLWVAVPLQDATGKLRGILYGGESLQRNAPLVDEIRSFVFGEDELDGKPIGTVTIFSGVHRVSTNVVDDVGERALGTSVSDEVAQAVLGEGRSWLDRAYVVDRYYLSAYTPITDPAGKRIGMLYAGTLADPFDALEQSELLRVWVLLGLAALAAILFGGTLVRSVTGPLRRLEIEAVAISEGDRDRRVDMTPFYVEIDHLAASFRRMQEAVAARDRELADHNEDLAKANRNYMETLGFVTHELKAPLGAMQTLIDTVLRGYLGPIPEKAEATLQRVKRSCEELRDMVKNWLDLSRAERGELAPNRRQIELIHDVVEPILKQNEPDALARGMHFDKVLGSRIEMSGDPELLRIAFGNFVSNAIKYGKDGGRIELQAAQHDGVIEVFVRNEGEGFPEGQREKLFQKFSRLDHELARSRRGSGLGLWLCRRIIEQHGGEVFADSQPGQWASFGFRIPMSHT